MFGLLMDLKQIHIKLCELDQYNEHLKRLGFNRQFTSLGLNVDCYATITSSVSFPSFQALVDSVSSDQLDLLRLVQVYRAPGDTYFKWVNKIVNNDFKRE